jgi:hypothetical protein
VTDLCGASEVDAGLRGERREPCQHVREFLFEGGARPRTDAFPRVLAESLREFTDFFDKAPKRIVDAPGSISIEIEAFDTSLELREAQFLHESSRILDAKKDRENCRIVGMVVLKLPRGREARRATIRERPSNPKLVFPASGGIA